MGVGGESLLYIFDDRPSTFYQHCLYKESLSAICDKSVNNAYFITLFCNGAETRSGLHGDSQPT